MIVELHVLALMLDEVVLNLSAVRLSILFFAISVIAFIQVWHEAL